MDVYRSGRANQRRRTRNDLLEAAARLMKQGPTPSLEEVAAAALVSRATAYRHFASIDALLAETALHVGVPSAAELFGDGATADPVARVERVEEALDEVILANEAAMRLMLAHSLERRLRGGGDNLPVRQNRRSPLLEAALEPARGRLAPQELRRLVNALALVVGTEARVVFRDVLDLDDAEAAEVKHWVIRTLIEAALHGSQPAGA